MSDRQPEGFQRDVDSHNAPAPWLPQAGFPAPSENSERSGIAHPWLGLPADHHAPANGQPHAFHPQGGAANCFDGDSLQGAHLENWPVVVARKAAVYLARLEPAGSREPHWHPGAWELNCMTAARVQWSFAGPASIQDVIEGAAGEPVFAPQGHFHYLGNPSRASDFVVLTAFNADTTEPKNDVSLTQSLSALPPQVLAWLLDVDPATFAGLPRRA